ARLHGGSRRKLGPRPAYGLRSSREPGHCPRRREKWEERGPDRLPSEPERCARGPDQRRTDDRAGYARPGTRASPLASGETDMAHPLLMVPASHRVGLTSLSLGLVRCLDRNGVKVGFYKPIAQLRRGPRLSAEDNVERSTALIRSMTELHPPEPLSMEEAERLFGSNHDELEQHIVSTYE